VHLARHEPADPDDTAEVGGIWSAEDKADLEREVEQAEDDRESIFEENGNLGIPVGGPGPQPVAVDPVLAAARDDDMIVAVAADEDGPMRVGEGEDGAVRSEMSAGVWGVAPNASLGLAPWPREFLEQQGPAPVVPLSIHAAGRARLNIQVALSELVGVIQLQAAATWGVPPSEFCLSLRDGALMDPNMALVHYVNGASALEAVAPGPRA
jgi:hypothetical protein